MQTECAVDIVDIAHSQRISTTLLLIVDDVDEPLPAGSKGRPKYKVSSDDAGEYINRAQGRTWKIDRKTRRY